MLLQGTNIPAYENRTETKTAARVYRYSRFVL